MFKKALVTGGAGFIGSHICERLVKMGVDVISLDNYLAGKEENLDGVKCTKVNGDILDEGLVSELMKGIDVVFHNAASKKTVCLKDPKLDLDVNGKGALILLTEALKNGVKKFVHASTGSVYGEPIYFPQDETHPLNPTSYYGVSKLAGERYVAMFNRVYHLNTTILRYYHVYGPKQDSSEFGGVVSIFIDKMLKKERVTIYGDGTQQRSFTFVDDVVEANIRVASDYNLLPPLCLTNGKSYNCASGLKITVYELYEKIAKILDYKLLPTYADWMIGDIKVFDVSNKKIASDIDMKFTSFDDGLQKTVEWFQNRR